MLSLTTKSRTEKVKDALSDVISYTDEIVRDKRLRSNPLRGCPRREPETVSAPTSATGSARRGLRTTGSCASTCARCWTTSRVRATGCGASEVIAFATRS